MRRRRWRPGGPAGKLAGRRRPAAGRSRRPKSRRCAARRQIIGKRLGAVGLLWLAVLAFFWPLITPDAANRRFFGPGDFWLQFVPFHTFAARQLAAGKLALWDPYMFSGHPFQADIQTAVLYPIAAANEWLGGWGFGYLALEWEAIVHFGLAAAFTYLLVELL